MTPAERKIYMKEYYLINKDRLNSDTVKRRKGDVKYLTYQSEYHEKWDLENIEAVRQYKRNYAKNNSGKKNHLTAKRRASKKNATPKWLSNDQIEEIKQFYIDAKEFQWLNDPLDPLEVDHIMPLQGENSCGLHVPWNLQIIPKSQNARKSNKMPTEDNLKHSKL